MNLVFANIKQHKFRTMLLILVALITFLIFGILGGALKAINPSDSIDASDELMVYSKVNLLTGIPHRYGDTLGQIDGVADWVPTLLLASHVGEQETPVSAEMTDVARYLNFYKGDIILDENSRDRFLNTRDGIIIDKELSERFGWKVGDRVTLNSDLILQKSGEGAWPFQVVGIYDEPEDSASGGVIGHYQYLENRVLAFDNRIHWFVVRTISADVTAKVAQVIDAKFINSPSETKTEPASAMARAFLSQVGDLTLIVKVVVGAAFVTMLLVIGNAISLSVQRRTKEFGVLRTIGFDKSKIFLIVFMETAFIIFIAFGLAMLLSAFVVASIFEGMSGLDVGALYLPRETLILGCVLAFLVALVTGGLPSIRAMRLKPTEAFRRG